ncbi:hypothetical protein LCGC14_2142120, partial [marine sediment metagenome]
MSISKKTVNFSRVGIDPDGPTEKLHISTDEEDYPGQEPLMEVPKSKKSALQNGKNNYFKKYAIH